MWKMKNLLRLPASLLALAVSLPMTAHPRGLRVVEVKPVTTVLHGKQIRTDLNGAEAAVVRVQLPLPGATFDGNLIGEPEYYSSEYWVWLEGDAAGSGTSLFDVRCPGAPTLHVDFSEFGIPVLKSKGVYELTLEIPHELLYGRSGAPISLGNELPEQSVDFNDYTLGDGHISVPSFLMYKGESDDGGPMFTDKSGEIRLFCDAYTNQDLASFHWYATNEIGNGKPDMDVYKNNYFVQSGHNYDGEIYYCKAYMNTDSTPAIFYHAVIIYPASKKEKMDKLLPRIFNSFPNTGH